MDLRPHAKAAGQPLGLFVLQSIIDPQAWAAPGYLSGVMPGYASRLTRRQLEDLVSFLIRRPYSIAPQARVSGLAARCDRSPACRRTVARWARLGRLPKQAQPGAKTFALAGCLTCHAYLGAGTRGTRSSELSAEGRRRRGVAWQIAYLRCPSCVVTGSRMPAFGDLGRTQLRRLAVFLEASKGKAGR